MSDAGSLKSFQMSNYARKPVTFVRGEGARLWDSDGNEYLDFLSGIGVLSVGHSNPAVVDAATTQLARLAHVSNLFWTEPAERLARKLSQSSLGGKVFFCNSGAEANEAAFKLARAKAYRAGRRAPGLVVFENAFHGRTMGALSATPQEAKQAPFAPLVPGVVVVSADDPDAVTNAVGDDTCAVLLEPVQGEGGVRCISDQTLLAAREACDRSGALLIFDEVQCGMGRTGTLWAYEQTPVTPDLITSAKALGGGLPVGALIATPECSEVFQPGDHGTTFGGGPTVAAAANAAFDILAHPALLASVVENGTHLADGLASYGTVTGRGLIRGLQLPTGLDAFNVADRALTEQNLIINATGPDRLRFLPPLTITPTDIKDLLTRLTPLLT